MTYSSSRSRVSTSPFSRSGSSFTDRISSSAQRLRPFDVTTLYYKRSRLSAVEEEVLGFLMGEIRRLLESKHEQLHGFIEEKVRPAASNSGSSNEAPAVNRPIVRLFGLLAVMFAVLVGFTSRWTVFEASSLRSFIAS